MSAASGGRARRKPVSKEAPEGPTGRRGATLRTALQPSNPGGFRQAEGKPGCRSGGLQKAGHQGAENANAQHDRQDGKPQADAHPDQPGASPVFLIGVNIRLKAPYAEKDQIDHWDAGYGSSGKQLSPTPGRGPVRGRAKGGAGVGGGYATGRRNRCKTRRRAGCPYRNGTEHGVNLKCKNRYAMGQAA